MEILANRRTCTPGEISDCRVNPSLVRYRYGSGGALVGRARGLISNNELEAGVREYAVELACETGEFTIPGLGKLVRAQRAARMGRNPATGESIKIAAKTTVKFRIGKAMKDAVVPSKK